VLQLLVTDHRFANPPRVRLKGQTYINLVSRWVVFSGWPSALPTKEQDLLEREEGEQLRMLCELREQRITDVRLGDDYPTSS
jgi:hypothetical protein